MTLPKSANRIIFQTITVVCACASSGALADDQIVFRDVTAQTGITFQHFDGSSGKYYIVETMSAGLALFDFDLDGDIDIYLLNGGAIEGSEADTGPRKHNALYRNDGKFRFTNVTLAANVGDGGHGLGVTVGDYDNDGDPDLFLNNFGPNVLYRNNGDGTFTDVTRPAGVQNGNRVGAGTSFLDMDADGDLDLYVANYIKFDYASHVPRTKQGYPIYGGPSDYDYDADTLFRNNGDGTFTDVSVVSGIAAHSAPGMGMVCADYDGDRDTDVFVANDGKMNYLFENDGRGQFQEVGLLRGFAYDTSGQVHASMGVACADYDNDGHLDLHVTSYQKELATLYRNINGAILEDVSHPSGAGLSTRAPVTWGNGFADFNNDGFRDIFMACGHLYDNLHHFDRTTTYRTPNILLRNLGNGKFANVSDRSGNGMAVRQSSRGVGLDDLDNDGDIDAVILNSRGKPTILRNDSKNENHWVQIQLRGTRSNRDGVGGRVELIAGDLRMVDEVHSGRGYQGHHGSRLHFGLGRHKRIDQLRIHWIGGGSDVINDLSADQMHTIIESRGVTRKPSGVKPSTRSGSP